MNITLLWLKALAALFIFIITLVGGVWPFLQAARRGQTNSAVIDFSTGEALITGIFLAIGLLHMLPEANTAFVKAGYHYPYAFLIAAGSFLSLLGLEHISVFWSGKAAAVLSSMVFLSVAMLSIHSLFEGAAVGLETNFAPALLLLIAILAHKAAEGFALSLQLRQSSLMFITRLLAFGLFALMTPVAIFAGSWIISSTANVPLLTSIFTALAAGTLIYLGALHGLERASLIRHCGNSKDFMVMLAGFLMMALVAIVT